MRRGLSHLLHRLAERVYHSDHLESVEVVDEYDICRCRIEVRADDFHGVGMAYELLPVGWRVGEARE